MVELSNMPVVLAILLVAVLTPVCILIAICSFIEHAVVLLLHGWEEAKTYGEPNPDLARKAVFLTMYLNDGRSEIASRLKQSEAEQARRNPGPMGTLGSLVALGD